MLEEETSDWNISQPDDSFEVFCAGYIPDSKVHWANMGPIWGRQDPGGPHVGPMNIAIWDSLWLYINTLRPELTAHYSADNILK